MKICISVASESRNLAKVDLLNASRQADIVEFCLDHLIKEPNVAELIEGIQKPILISCRRREDGGQWQGTEEERLLLLRQAIVAQPEYVELDLEIANKIPRFGKTKRVISFTSLDEPVNDVEEIVNRAVQAKADVVKVTWPTPTLDAAWPMLAAVSQKRDIPVVAAGIGSGGVTFSLLGCKYGAPWIYAALERGMESYAEQPTVSDFEDLYFWRGINTHTRFVGVAGMTAVQQATIKTFNTGFDKLELNYRCLPIFTGRFDRLGKMLDVLKINSIVTGPEAGELVFPLAEKSEDAAKEAGYADLLLKQPEGWQAYNTLWRGMLKSLEARLGKTNDEDRPLDRRNVLVVGHGPATRSIVYGLLRRKPMLSITSPDDKASRKLAEQFNIRHVPFASLYDTLSDVVVFSHAAMQLGHRKTEFNAAYLRPQMTVLDASNLLEETPVLAESRARRCPIVENSEVFAHQLATQFKSITGKELPSSALREALAAE
ncbi:MAG: type I 3-dehydroquinate dehydratase [Planctomycetota bacterium]|nr:type I 3-dehydroquinate dehydratase [Planctomycetota bacterium]MDA1213781.1 type I 3-dehydroquinate dehydratase [Planctomycetota bacterium]